MLFTQVKLSTRQPETLAEFYVKALECEVVLPLTTLDPVASRGVGAPGTEVGILVLSLPGHEGGPTLELISIGEDSLGPGQLTFFVEDVGQAAERVLSAGGAFKGEIVDFVGPSGGTSRFVFMTDPEGNVIDLYQSVG